MSISEIPVGFDEVFFISAAEDFQNDGEGERRVSYDGGSYLLDVQVSAYVTERGLRALASQAITLEIPTAGAAEALKTIRGLPPQTPVRFASLSARSGISKGNNSLWTMWTGRGMETIRSTQPQRSAAVS
ncbi:MAG: hypothetical protein JWM31_1950 [Solirubrobacterales bacterium]|nr:hypothetical protein [Solirubrobacterales bacterium]